MYGEELIYALQERLHEIDRNNSFFEYICTIVKLKEEKFKLSLLENLGGNDGDIDYTTSLVKVEEKNYNIFTKIISFFANIFKK